ncbi:MAG: hypothetical protein LBQ06_07620 [Frankiaceae bacterium]|nr:hypothetical protein [Frankiaceae bacterium]
MTNPIGTFIVLFYLVILLNVAGFADFIVRRALLAYPSARRIGAARMKWVVRAHAVAGAGIGIAFILASR